jgi:hypothetical protein
MANPGFISQSRPLILQTPPFISHYERAISQDESMILQDERLILQNESLILQDERPIGHLRCRRVTTRRVGCSALPSRRDTGREIVTNRRILEIVRLFEHAG